MIIVDVETMVINFMLKLPSCKSRKYRKYYNTCGLMVPLTILLCDKFINYSLVSGLSCIENEGLLSVDQCYTQTT